MEQNFMDVSVIVPSAPLPGEHFATAEFAADLIAALKRRAASSNAGGPTFFQEVRYGDQIEVRLHPHAGGEPMVADTSFSSPSGNPILLAVNAVRPLVEERAAKGGAYTPVWGVKHLIVLLARGESCVSFIGASSTLGERIAVVGMGASPCQPAVIALASHVGTSPKPLLFQAYTPIELQRLGREVCGTLERATAAQITLLDILQSLARQHRHQARAQKALEEAVRALGHAGGGSMADECQVLIADNDARFCGVDTAALSIAPDIKLVRDRNGWIEELRFTVYRLDRLKEEIDRLRHSGLLFEREQALHAMLVSSLRKTYERLARQGAGWETNLLTPEERAQIPARASAGK
jgi:hypothetical protein